MKIQKIILGALLIVGSTSQMLAQENTSTDNNTSKAWEFGLGGSVFQFSRTSFSNFADWDGGYEFDLGLKQAVFGANIYAARELNSHFYIDVQGTAGFAKSNIGNDSKNKSYFMVGPGLQWRLGDYFGSKYIDPYVRGGISYMRKNFDILYKGTEGLNPDQMDWILQNVSNKDGVDRKDLMPISLGGGLNMWLNDHVGIGFQADYLLMPYKEVANSLQGTVRVMCRIGGESKVVAPRIEYVEIEKIKEKIVEKPVIVEKIVEGQKIVETKQLYDHFNDITFEFNSDELTTESKKSVDEIANILKQDPNKKYLITGYTDSKGSPQYNEALSKKRASSVVKALVDRGVSTSSIKSRGVGSKVSYATPSASDIVRKGDRKVTIEIIGNMDYWDYLPTSDL